jgi:single-strand DNA-binding protein
MINRFLGMGNLTKDPNCKQTERYTLCSFSLAINDPVKKDEVLYIDVSCWNKIAENCSKYLKKGSRVFVEGKLKLESWKDQSGTSRNKIVLVADNVRFMPSNQDSEKSNPKIEKSSNKDIIVDDDDDEFDQIPF